MSLAKSGFTTFRVASAPADYGPGVATGALAAATTIFLRPAVVKEIVVNSPAGNGTVEIHDVATYLSTAAPAVANAKFNLKIQDIPATTPSYTIRVDAELKAGFFLRVLGATIDVTVVYRPMGRTAPNAPKVFIQRR